MLTTEEIKKELDAGREVELECVDEEGFIKQGIRHVRESTLESSLIVDYITNYGSGLHVKIKDLKSSISAGSLKYFRIKRPAPTFDDLIDVAAQAKKDGIVSEIHWSNDQSLSVLCSDGAAVSATEEVTSAFIRDAINGINSLYTETFVIEQYFDTRKMISGAKVILTNGEEVVFSNRSGVDDPLWFEYNDCHSTIIPFIALKGATVTQKRGK